MSWILSSTHDLVHSGFKFKDIWPACGLAANVSFKSCSIPSDMEVLSFWERETCNPSLSFQAALHQQGPPWSLVWYRSSRAPSWSQSQGKRFYLCPGVNAQSKDIRLGCPVSVPDVRSHVEVWATGWGQVVFTHIHIFVVLIALFASGEPAQCRPCLVQSPLPFRWGCPTALWCGC